MSALPDNIDSRELSLFEKTPLDDSITSTYILDHRPLHKLNEGNIIEILVNPSEDYIKLSGIHLHGKFKVVKQKLADGEEENLAAGDDVSIANLPASSIFKLLTLTLNGTEVTDRSSYLYGHKAWVETVLNYTGENKDTYLKNFCHFIPDTEGKEDKTTVADNTGYKKRADLIKESREVEFFSKLHIDMLTCTRLLLNAIEMKFTFHRQSEEAVLISPANWTTHRLKIKITMLKLRVPYVKLSRSKADSIASRLTKEAALYPFNMIRTISHDIPKASSGTIIRTLATGKLPDLVLLAFVQGKKFEDLKSNMLYYNHENLSRYYFLVNGVIKTAPQEEIDFDNDKYLGLYYHMIKTLKLDDPNHPVPLKKEFFKSAFSVLVLDTVGCWGGQKLHETPHGQLDICLTFKDIPNDSISIISFQVFNASVSIDKDRIVTLNKP